MPLSQILTTLHAQRPTRALGKTRCVWAAPGDCDPLSVMALIASRNAVACPLLKQELA